MDGSKGKGSRRFPGKRVGTGWFDLHVPILSKTTGASDKRRFFRGLIAKPVQTGEDQIFAPVLRVFRNARRFGSNLDVPRPSIKAREGRRFNLVLPDGR